MAENTDAKKITINDIAISLGCSKTTVSRAISGKGRVSEHKKKEVFDYIKKHNYSPNLMAKGLAESKTFNIGVILPNDENSVEMPFFHKCLIGIAETAAFRNYDSVIIMAGENDTAQLKNVVNKKKIDGVILMRVLVNDPLVDFLKNSGIPFIVVGSFHDEKIIQIDHNHRKASFELTEKLIISGNKNIAFIGDNLNSIVNINRYQGYIDALNKNEVKINEKLIHFLNTKSEIAASVKTVMKYETDCILCMDDFVCSLVIASLDFNGYKIPGDIKVASLYNNTFLSNHVPAISAVDFNIMELGREACKILLDKIKNKDVKIKTLLEYKIMLKQST